jgi:hypothetical protein
MFLHVQGTKRNARRRFKVMVAFTFTQNILTKAF